MNGFLQRVEDVVIRRCLLSRGQKILVAVSGGADSMLLLHALNLLAPKNRWKISVAHFNHQLRGRASEADEKFVRRTAEKLRLQFYGGGADVNAFAASGKISVEMAARKLRHEFLARTAHQQKIPVVALAHHADDQVELFFLRLLRGAGGEGLAGMKWCSPSPADKTVSLIRPLLGFTKEELLGFAVGNKIRFREDATNASPDFLRNRIRNELLPLLEKNYQPGLTKTVLRVMEVVGAETEFAGAAASQWLGSAPATGAAGCAPHPAEVRAKISGGSKNPGASGFSARARKTAPGAGALPEFEKLPVAVQRKVLQTQLIQLGLVSDFELIEQLRESAGKFVSVNRRQLVRRKADGRIELSQPDSPRFNPAELRFKLSGRAGRVAFHGRKFHWVLKRFSGAQARSHQPAEFFDADKIGGKIILRHWRAGDRFQPIGLKSAVKLQDLFVNAKIPTARRRNLVLATTATNEIFWVETLRIGERFKLVPKTKRVLAWNCPKIAA